MSNFHQLYSEKLTTAEGIAARIRPHWVMSSDIGLGMPYVLLDTIGEYLYQHKVEGVVIHTILDLRPLNCYEPHIAPYFRSTTCFSGAWARKAVTTSKNDVDCIVTEYGIARLRGKTLWQRTKELIAVAHPDFRDQLLYDARKMNIIV